jgi:hypothetical protein
MGVLSVAADFPVQATYDATKRVYRLPYKVETTTDTVEAQVALALKLAVPFNANYVGDPLARVARYEINQASNTRDQWNCFVVFEYDVPDQGEVNPDSVLADLAPWQYPPLRSFSTVMRQKPAKKAWFVKRTSWHSRTETTIGDGTAVVPAEPGVIPGVDIPLSTTPTDKIKILKENNRVPIYNTAGLPYDPPPLVDVPHRVVHWKINYPKWNEILARAVVGSVNYLGLGDRYDSLDDGNVPDAYTYPPFSLKVLAFDAEEKLEGRFRWWAATLSAEYNPDLWVEEFINRGFTEKVYDQMDNDQAPWKFLGYRALKFNEAQLLDEYGRMWRKDRTSGEIKADPYGITPYIVQPVANYNGVFGTLKW